MLRSNEHLLYLTIFTDSPLLCCLSIPSTLCHPWSLPSYSLHLVFCLLSALLSPSALLSHLFSLPSFYSLHLFYCLSSLPTVSLCSPVFPCLLLSLSSLYLSDCSPLFSGLDRQLSHGDSVSGSERSPSIFPEHTHPLSSGDQPQHLLQQPSSGLLPLPHLSDQLVPDASCKDGVPQPSDTDFEVLRLAISHLRAERQAQLQQQRFDSQSEFSINPLKSFLPNPSHNTPPAGQGGPTESARLTLGRKAVATTLDLIHSALQPELGEEGRKEDRVEAPTEGQRRGRSLGGGEPGDGCPTVGLVGGNQGPSNNDTSIPLSSQSTTRPNDQTDSTDVRREKVEQQKDSVFLKAAQQGAASFSTSSCPVEGDRSR